MSESPVTPMPTLDDLDAYNDAADRAYERSAQEQLDAEAADAA